MVLCVGGGGWWACEQADDIRYMTFFESPWPPICGRRGGMEMHSGSDVAIRYCLLSALGGMRLGWHGVAMGGGIGGRRGRWLNMPSIHLHPTPSAPAVGIGCWLAVAPEKDPPRRCFSAGVPSVHARRPDRLELMGR